MKVLPVTLYFKALHYCHFISRYHSVTLADNSSCNLPEKCNSRMPQTVLTNSASDVGEAHHFLLSHQLYPTHRYPSCHPLLRLFSVRSALRSFWFERNRLVFRHQTVLAVYQAFVDLSTSSGEVTAKSVTLTLARIDAKAASVIQLLAGKSDPWLHWRKRVRRHVCGSRSGR